MGQELRAHILARRDDAPLLALLETTIAATLAANGILAEVVGIADEDAAGIGRVVDGILAGGGARIVVAVAGDQSGCSSAPFEALRARVARPIPGVAEFIRRAGSPDPLAPLFDPPSGISLGGAMLLGLPRDAGWLSACIETLAPVIRHAVEKAAGDPRDCGR